MAHRAALITALILERPLCIRCIQEKSGLRPPSLRTTLSNIRTVLRVRREHGRCRACGIVTSIVSLHRPPR
jgi:hypothetical protein